MEVHGDFFSLTRKIAQEEKKTPYFSYFLFSHQPHAVQWLNGSCRRQQQGFSPSTQERGCHLGSATGKGSSTKFAHTEPAAVLSAWSAESPGDHSCEDR